MRLTPTSATLAYFGSKAAVLGDLFRALDSVLPRSEWSQATFVDAFLGGGSVAQRAKRLGFRVIANDLAERACITGRALITNSRVTLTEADELRLHAGHESNDHRIEQEMAPRYFLPEHARWLDGAFAAARAVPDDARRNLLLLVLMHACLRVRPFADFSRTQVTEAFAQGDYDAIKLTVGGIRRLVKLTPHTLVAGLRERVNAGVFSNGREGHAVHQEDAAEFVRTVQGEVLYLDPPYVGSNAYEKVYGALDLILEHRTEHRPVSMFNQPGAMQALDQLLDAAAHFPAWVLSFGGGKITHDELLARVRRHRPTAELAPIHLRYRVGTAIYGESGAAREILITARRSK